MRALLLSLAASLVLPGVSLAADKLYLSRTLEFDFNAPGKITRIDVSGETPVSEEMRRNSWILILPKRLNLTLSITNANEDEHHYHVAVHLKDELAPAQKVEGFVLPTDAVKMFWLDRYRFQFTMLRKDASPKNNFHSATIKLDVYVPEPKPKP